MVKVRSLDDVFADYLQFSQWEKQLAKQTLYWYERTYATLKTHLDSMYGEVDHAVNTFSEESLRSFFVSKTKAGLSTVSLHFYWRFLRTFCRWMIRRELIKGDPMINLVRPRPQRRVPDALNEGEIKALMRYMVKRKEQRPYSIQYTRDIALVGLLLMTGLRRAEALSLKVEDVDFNDNVIRLSHTKSGRVEKQPINTPLRQLLQNYLKRRAKLKRQHNHLWVCVNRSGANRRRGNGAFSTRGLHLLMKDINANAGIQKHVTAHMMRRTFATSLLRRDVSLVHVSKLLRHKDISTTVRHYLDIDTFELAKGVERLRI